VGRPIPVSPRRRAFPPFARRGLWAASPTRLMNGWTCDRSSRARKRSHSPSCGFSRRRITTPQNRRQRCARGVLATPHGDTYRCNRTQNDRRGPPWARYAGAHTPEENPNRPSERRHKHVVVWSRVSHAAGVETAHAGESHRTRREGSGAPDMAMALAIKRCGRCVIAEVRHIGRVNRLILEREIPEFRRRCSRAGCRHRASRLDRTDTPRRRTRWGAREVLLRFGSELAALLACINWPAVRLDRILANEAHQPGRLFRSSG